MRRILLLLLVLAVPSFAWAEDIYIAQTATGGLADANPSTSCNVAHGATWFNTFGNWSSTVPSVNKINPSDTVHLCGTITTALGAQGSGSSGAGNAITILFESGAKLSAPFCSASGGCLNLSNKSFIIVDGGANGIIESNANGTLLANKVSSIGLMAHPCTNCEIKNLTIQNIYVHTFDPSDNTVPDGSLINAIRFSGSNTTVHHNVIHDAAWAIYLPYGAGNANLEVHHNTIYNASHDLAVGGFGSVSLNGFKYYNNHTYDHANWDTTANSYHHNSIHVYRSFDAPANATNIEVYNNLMEGTCGTGSVTSQIYLESGPNTAWTTGAGVAKVFNNVAICETFAFGIIGVGAGTIQVYNNVVKGGDSSTGKCMYVNNVTNAVVKNNALEGCQYLLEIVGTTSFASPSDMNYNTYGTCTTTKCWLWKDPTGVTGTNNFSIWKDSTHCNGCDTDSSNNIGTGLSINSAGAPTTGSPMINSGTNLTNLGITALNSDLNANTRPSSGAWTTGAYNYGFFPSARPTWFHFDMEFIDSNIGTATTTYPYFTGYHLWPQAAGSTPPILAPATITALSPGGASQTKDFILFYPAAGGSTMANGLPSPAQKYFNAGLTRINPLVSVITGNQTEMRNLTIASGSSTRIIWDVMPEWDGLGGHWLPTTVGLFQSGTRAGNYTGFRTYVSTNWTPLWTMLQTAQATRGYLTAGVTDFTTSTHYALEWGLDIGMMERAIDECGDLATGTAFVRGAASQYNKAWGIDMSLFRTSAGGSVTTYNQATGKQTGGWSAEYMKRHHYLAYMAGANQIQNEAVNFRYADTSLNPFGLMMQTFNGWAASHPTRGTAVVPIALMMDHDHGFVPRHWVYSDAPLAARAVWYGKLSYNIGDQAVDSLFTQLWPDHWRHGQSLGWDSGTTVKDTDFAAFLAWIQAGNDPRPFEPMPNSTYGDMFDVLLSDAPIEALHRYNVVMPIGNFVMTAGWRTLMTDYATSGGTVVLNMSQVTAADEALLGVTLGSTTTSTSSKWGAESNLTESTYTYRIVTPTTATVIATNPANGNPLITMRTLGAGRVYFVAPNYMQNNTAPNPALLNISKRLLQDLTETYRQGWAEGTPVDFLTTQGTDFKTVTVSNNSAAIWSGNVKFKQNAPTSAVEWLTNQSLSYTTAGGVTTIAVTVPAFDVRIFALNGSSGDVLPPAAPTNITVQ